MPSPSPATMPSSKPARFAIAAYRDAAQEGELAAQTERLVRAQAILASPKPTKKAETDQRVATSKLAAAQAKLGELNRKSQGDGYGRIWPGSYCQVLMRDTTTGERLIVPMRYLCRLPGWTTKDEAEKPLHLQRPAGQALNRLAQAFWPLPRDRGGQPLL